MVFFQIFPINVKGSAGTLCNLVSWICSWIVSYTFNFLFKWSSAGDASHFYFLCVIQSSYWWLTCACLFRNIFHICEYLWFGCCFHCKTSTGDQRTNIGRNTCITYSNSAMRNIKAVKGIPTIVVTCASCNASASVYLNQKLRFKKDRNYTRNVIKILVYFRRLNDL